jgi:VCBS repeat-containing protein
MSLTTFTEFLQTKGLSTTGLTQSQFSTNYTAWLTSIFSDANVQQWLRDTYKIDLAGQAIQVNLNQNSSTLLPTVNGITDQRIYDALFGDKSSLMVGTGKTAQERSYVSGFEADALKAMFAPKVSGPVTGQATEDGATVTLNALANVTDADTKLDNLKVSYSSLPAGVTYDEVTKSFVLDTSNEAYQHLAKGQTDKVSFTYIVSDGKYDTTASATWTITGTNDVPTVSGAVTGTATEDGSASILNALANATDKDDGAVLTVVNVPAADKLPAGVAYDAATHTFSLDPSNVAFQHLAAGQEQVVTVHYGVSDGISTTDASVSWTITGANDAPTSVSLDHSSVAENAAGAVIGKLSAVDPDDNDVISFAVLKADGSGAVDNRFTVDASGNLKLATGVSLDYETASSINVIVRGSDKGGLFKDQAFTITVQDVNEAPTAVQLVNKLASTPENGGAVKVADINVIDDALGNNLLSLSGADSGSFLIETNATTGAKELWFKGGADFEKKMSYDVKVSVDDLSVGASPDAFDTFHFGITDVVEGTRVTFDNVTSGVTYTSYPPIRRRA